MKRTAAVRTLMVHQLRLGTPNTRLSFSGSRIARDRLLSTSAEEAVVPTPSLVLNRFLERDAAQRQWQVGLLAVPKFSVAVLAGVAVSGGLAAMQNHTERTRPIVLRGSATAAYGIKNDPFTYLGLWGIGICTAAAVGSLYGFLRMGRRFGKWSQQQPNEWLPLMPAARALLAKRTFARTGLGTAGFLAGVFAVDRAMDRVLLSAYTSEAQNNLFTQKNLPPTSTVDAYILSTHVGYLLVATLLLSFTPHIVLPSLIAAAFAAVANFKVYMLASQRNRRLAAAGVVRGGPFPPADATTTTREAATSSQDTTSSQST